MGNCTCARSPEWTRALQNNRIITRELRQLEKAGRAAFKILFLGTAELLYSHANSIFRYRVPAR